MKLARYYHSCVVVEEGADRILIDPGSFCFLPGRAKPENFTEIGAIFISHNHADHADVQALSSILKNNPVKVYSNKDVAATLKEAGIEVEVVSDRQVIRVGTLEVECVAASHGKLLVPIPENTAFFVNKKYLHPGDSHDSVLYEFAGVEVLGVPIAAPWMNVVQGAEFVKAMRPKQAIAIHDQVVSEAFIDRARAIMAQPCEEVGAKFHAMTTPEESLEV